jgi:hypothetical protein
LRGCAHELNIHKGARLVHWVATNEWDKFLLHAGPLLGFIWIA